jgi:hypothetical protein
MCFLYLFGHLGDRAGLANQDLPKGRFFKKGLVWQLVFVQPKLLA